MIPPAQPYRRPPFRANRWLELSGHCAVKSASVSWGEFVQLAVEDVQKPARSCGMACGAQDDSMAMGARKAFQELGEGDRGRWLRIPVTGCDGMPRTGQAWVKNGTLAATIFIPPNTDLAIAMLVEAFKNGSTLPENRVTTPESVPPLAELAAAGKKATRAAGA